MRKKVNIKRHLVAFVLTLCFFVIGILIGSQITHERLSYLQDKSQDQNLDFESLQTQYLYVSLMKENKSCAVVQETFQANVDDLEDTRKELEEFIKSSQINQRSYFLLKREYIISQLRYWLLAESTQEVCDTDFVSVFYFFSNPSSCQDCGSQGLILTYLKKIFQDKLLIFSFDADFEDEPFISILKRAYNVTEYPTIIINDGLALEGLQGRDGLFSEICSEFKNNYSVCVEN